LPALKAASAKIAGAADVANCWHRYAIRARSSASA
jgi:hypothetical protein